MDRLKNPGSGDRTALPSDLPDDIDPNLEEVRYDHSLIEDLDALLSDSKTYVSAEIAYQKSRVSFAGNRTKWAFVHGAAAFGLIHLALIAFTVGAVLALVPTVGPWVATGIVVVTLFAASLFFVSKLRNSLREIGDVFDEAGK